MKIIFTFISIWIILVVVFIIVYELNTSPLVDKNYMVCEQSSFMPVCIYLEERPVKNNGCISDGENEICGNLTIQKIVHK